MRLFRRLHVPVLLLVFCLVSGRAQESASAPVARLSHLAGSVQVQAQDGTDAVTDAALNMPLPQGERISTGEAGEAEVEFTDGSVLRLTPNSTAVLTRLDASAELQLNDGLFYLELRYSDRGSYSVLAADQTIAPQENSSFRIHVTGSQVETGVLSGAVSVSRRDAYTADLQAGESLRSDPKNPKRYFLASTLPQEAWDNWNEKLSQAAMDEAALRTSARDTYAGDQGYGWADLDANGTWYNVPGEGSVWQPTAIDAGFDPYGYGSWTYGPGGYTWASGYSWGWLPYRCGQWSYYLGFGWGWLPATGCRNYGGGYGGGYSGWNGSRFPVRNPPQGWHPPRRPVEIAGGAVTIHRHPTIPVRLVDQTSFGSLPPRRLAEGGPPVKIGNVPVTVIKPVGKGSTPQGGSAVGSTLLRDFPVHTGTHEPVLGLQTQGPVAIPGRPAEWHRVGPAGGTVAREPAATAPPAGGVPVYGGQVYDRGTYLGRGGEQLPSQDRTVQRYPRPTDPPVNATGAPPVNATGTPPRNATGVPAGASPVQTYGDRHPGGLPTSHGTEGMRMHPLPPPRQVEPVQPYRAPVQQTPTAPRVFAPAPPPPAAPRYTPPPSAPPPMRPTPAPSAPPAPRAAPTIR